MVVIKENYLNIGRYYDDSNTNNPLIEDLTAGTYYLKLIGQFQDYTFELVIESQEVTFADENLSQTVSEAVYSFANEVTINNLRKINRLDANCRGITSLDGLQYLSNLEELNMEDNNISDISILSQLQNLYYLNLDNNNISDISAISGLTKMTDLSLANNNISDISVLGSLSNLTYVRLNNNNITNISALSTLSDIEYLYLANNQIGSFTPVKGYYSNLKDKDFVIASDSTRNN